MPGVDGFQTARRLKMDRRLKHKAFIAHTADTDPLLKGIAQRAGFEHVLPKGDPESVSALIDVLAQLAKAGSAAQRHRSNRTEE